MATTRFIVKIVDGCPLQIIEFIWVLFQTAQMQF